MLLYYSGPKTLRTLSKPWDDNPMAFLHELHETAEGCRWLLERWCELRNQTCRSVDWTKADMFKLIRLQGKFPIEAINDPTLNAIFLAWDAISPGTAKAFWPELKKCQPLADPGFSDSMRWREITDRPADAPHAVLFLTTFVDQQISDLEERIAVHEEIAGDEAADLADRASFEPSASFERLRRYQTSKRRELRQAIDALLNLRDRRGRKTDEECQMSKYKCQMLEYKCQMASGGCVVGNGSRQRLDLGTETGRFVNREAEDCPRMHAIAGQDRRT
jgi:hypothetical protein